MPVPVLIAGAAILDAIFAMLARLGFTRVFAIPAIRNYLYGLAGSITIELIKVVKEFITSNGVRDVVASLILEKAGIDIAPEDIENKEAWKVAIGKRAADLINLQLGTTINNIYPPDQFKAQIKAQVQQDILNRGGKIVDFATVQQLLIQIRQAADLAVGLSGTAIVPILGNRGIDEKIRRERNNTRARQRAYRQAHPRLQVWVTPDLAAATAAYKAQIAAIIAARP